MFRATRIGLLIGLILLGSVFLPTTGSAHEYRELVNGTVAVEVGFQEEPALVGEKNGLYLNVTTATGEPIEGLADTLQAEVIYGDQTMALTLIPAFDEPGTYTAMFFPMAEGDYTFRIFGDLEGTAIDELFTSSPEGFDAVESREPYEFPKP